MYQKTRFIFREGRGSYFILEHGKEKRDVVKYKNTNILNTN